VNPDFLFKGEDELVGRVIDFFLARVLDKEHFSKVVEICLQDPDMRGGLHPIFIRKGQFTLKNFIYYWITTHPSGGVMKDIIIQEVVNRLCSARILAKSEFLKTVGLDYYEVNDRLAKFFLERDALDNLVFGFPYLVEKYAPSVLHLVVTDRFGDVWNGTGFLLLSKNWVFTNKHIVEEDANNTPKVITVAGQEIAVNRIHCCDSNDLALIELNEPVENARVLFPYGQIDALDDIITIGYPRIPLATTAPVVAHKGEINGTVALAHGTRILFSAKTAPGNSGGPLINRAGLVVGIVTEELRSRAAELHQIQPYFAAISTNDIVSFLKELSTSRKLASLTYDKSPIETSLAQESA
jgi:S1-C subfamily serine protease